MIKLTTHRTEIKVRETETFMNGTMYNRIRLINLLQTGKSFGFIIRHFVYQRLQLGNIAGGLNKWLDFIALDLLSEYYKHITMCMSASTSILVAKLRAFSSAHTQLLEKRSFLRPSKNKIEFSDLGLSVECCWKE